MTTALRETGQELDELRRKGRPTRSALWARSRRDPSRVRKRARDRDPSYQDRHEVRAIADRMEEARRQGPERAPRLFIFVDPDPPERPSGRRWSAIQWFENGRWNRRDMHGNVEAFTTELAFRLGRLIHTRPSRDRDPAVLRLRRRERRR